ncbi:hypothetical protein ACT4WY_19610 (plasmid) [Acinetobacter baumannii]
MHSNHIGKNLLRDFFCVDEEETGIGLAGVVTGFTERIVLGFVTVLTGLERKLVVVGARVDELL